MKFNINTDEVVKFTNKLEKMHKSALPSAIRGTLNDAVRDVKTNTMLDESKKKFVNRSPNFFKSQSRYEKALGFNVDSMESSVGFVEGGLKGGDNYSVKDLEEQESGGTINKKSFIPLNTARISKSANKVVRANARLKSIKKIVNARNQKGKSKAEKFVNATLKAGIGGFVLGSTINGENILWRVDSLKSNLKTRKFTPKLTPLYDFNKGRSIKVKATNFMHKASIYSAKKMNWFYEKQAKRQIEKLITR